MAQEGPNRFAEWVEVLRAQVPVFRRRFEDWLAIVRGDPALIWQTVAVRYTVYIFGALVLFWIVSGAMTMFTPPAPADARPEATSADFHVICTNPECGHHYVIHREFGFRKFPVVCPECGQKTGAQARRCNSPTCLGRWVAPEKREDGLYCPRCGARFD